MKLSRQDAGNLFQSIDHRATGGCQRDAARGLSGPHPGDENCVQNALLTGPAPGGRGGVCSSWPSETHPLLLAPYPCTPPLFPASFPPILQKSYRTRLPNQEIFSPGTDERRCGFWSSPLYPDLEPHNGAPTPPTHVPGMHPAQRVSHLETTGGFIAPCLSFYAYICVISDWELPNKICIKNR